MRSYVTLLSDARYVDGVIVLHRALRAVNSIYPLHCVLSVGVDDEVKEKISEEGIAYIQLKQHIATSSVIPKKHCYSHWNNTFDKLQIWGLTQFDKIVFLDSDLLILNNIDSLFEHDPFSGVCAGKSFPGNENWHGINSGVMVLKPDESVMQELIDFIPNVVEVCKREDRPMGDQDVLQYYLTEKWDATPSLQLDEGYNVFGDFLNYYIKNLKYSWDDKAKRKIYIVHFIGHTKPWMKLSLRERYWLLKKLLFNPYYIVARRKFRSYLYKKK